MSAGAPDDEAGREPLRLPVRGIPHEFCAAQYDRGRCSNAWAPSASASVDTCAP
ncbi:MAG: hypothetical protein H0T76_27805 [Nannocystis sp.]|nr:hypothetical protein [Nannocystis sp.]MBA3550298.1 hypothetical protein [Nannocystis sp.]